DEVRAIEAIQALLDWGQPQQAGEALAQYRRRFPSGELGLEGDLLEVDIAVASGDRAHAKELARGLLERPMASRYRARLAALLEPKATATPAMVGSKATAAQMK